MIKTVTIYLLLIISISLFWIDQLNAQIVLDIESGVVSTGYNNVRIPGDQGTLFSLKKDFDPSIKIFYRIRVDYNIGARHTLSALYAPLTTTSSGRASNDIAFSGVTFPANTDIEGTYKFNSYRLTYRYKIIQKEQFDFGLGFTAKIRDARIALSTPGLEGEKVNVGFVPIVNFRLLWHLNEKLGLLIDGDALAAKQGRAEDILIAATYRLTEKIEMKAGYRLLEGGADNDEVYNFALFHYGSIGFLIYL